MDGQVVEVQISPARMVQLTEEGNVAHRTTGLRDLRLCTSCGEYLVSGFERLLAAYGRGTPRGQQRRAG
ncbi:MAG: hypothetical protein EPO16_05140 [Dehalococcoidia bacterium]|nr:MAG: hypothetical protein EPO16_05140 [Dehalococcoidia bacterium]